MKTFNDHFSDNSDTYRQFRPGYPAALFAYLATITSEQHTAWDCATGTGQCAHLLTDHFTQVIATDASGSQIEHAIQHKKITYQVATAEHSGLDPSSIDLITVAQALHWFDLPQFFDEARRVLKPDGVLACWSYQLLTIRPDIDDIIHHLYGPVLNAYWPAERQLIETGYETIEFPFMAIRPPEFTMSMKWDLQQLVGYLNTWSAVKYFIEDKGTNPIDKLTPELERAWGKPDDLLRVDWPLALKVCSNATKEILN